MLGKQIRNLGGQLFSVTLALAILTGCRNLSQAASLTPVEASPSSTAVMPTSSPTQSATSTPRITLVPKYTPTPRLITPAPAEGTLTDQSMVSPDGNWTALPAFEILPDGYRVSLQVFNKDQSVVWTPVDYKGDGLGYTFPSPKRWSSDSRYFYYVELITGSGEFFPIDQSWLQLDTQTGKVAVIGLPVGRGHMTSPDESILAYTPATAPLRLVLLEIQTQTDLMVPLFSDPQEDQNAQAGSIVWSPAGDALIVAIAKGINASPHPTFSLVSVQRTDLKTTILYQGKDYVRPLQWTAGDKILVKDWNSKSWWINAADGEITSAPTD